MKPQRDEATSLGINSAKEKFVLNTPPMLRILPLFVLLFVRLMLNYLLLLY